MSTSVGTPPSLVDAPSAIKNRSRRKPQAGYASDSAAQQAAAFNGTNGSSTGGQTIPKRKPNKRPTQPKEQHEAAPSGQVSQLDGALSPRPSPAQTRAASAVPDSPSLTPAKQAYAGPTFHASPAAMSLPKPKFFSKSMPSAAAPSGLQARLDAESDNEIKELPSPANRRSPHIAPQSQKPPRIAREDSPLDLFFNAHRAEKARQPSSGEALASDSAAHRSTPSLYHSSSSFNTPASQRLGQTSRVHRTHPSQTPSNKEVFQMEVDGAVDADSLNYDSSDWDEAQQHQRSASQSVPFSDRLRGYGSDSVSGSPVGLRQRPQQQGLRQQRPPQQHQQQAPQHYQQQDFQRPTMPPLERNMHSEELLRQTQSQALKRMLMMQPDAVPPQSNGQTPSYQPQGRHVSAPVERGRSQMPQGSANGHGYPVQMRSGVQTQMQGSPHGLVAGIHDTNGSGPPPNSQSSSNVKSMENDLRRMLRLS